MRPAIWCLVDSDLEQEPELLTRFHERWAQGNFGEFPVDEKANIKPSMRVSSTGLSDPSLLTTDNWFRDGNIDV